MALDVGEFIKILNKQKTLIDELCDLSGDQIQAIKLGDVPRLSSFSSRQEYVARQLEDTEKERLALLEKYSTSIGVKIGHYNDLKTYAKSIDFTQIQVIREEILDRSKRLKKNNELSALLLRQSIKYTERMLQILKAQKSSTYGRSGEIYKSGRRKLVDTNV